jgi:predicted RNase H-like nuclease/RimJ/RimL family protein N-acetyltransferase
LHLQRQIGLRSPEHRTTLSRVGRDVWPLFQLRVRTPRVELRPPTDDDLFALVDLAARGVHDPSTMPFTTPWTDASSPVLERSSLQFFWKTRAEWVPERWHCVMAVEAGGQLVGVQDVMATDFPTLREVVTGSWLGMAHQRQGIGTEMRAAVLHLAFAGLGAEYALSGAFHDNAASRRVSEHLGYELVAHTRRLRRGEPDWAAEYRLSRAAWEQHRRDDITIVGLEPCLDLFGADTKPACAGVDACRGGWAVATRDGARVMSALDELIADATITVIAIDMPIGLPRAWGRSCDRDARARLGPRRSSVFDTPPRSLLAEPTYESANARSLDRFGRGISRQSYGLMGKIAVVDALVSPADEARIVEVHPETSFAALAGTPLPPKRSLDGLAARRRILEPVFGSVETTLRGAQPDDVLDAYAALWSAERFAAGRHEVLGDGQRDDRGLVMRMVV